MPHPTDPACIFCKIVAGQIPCHRVFENEHVLSFLDIGPLSRGHTLIIPRGHWVTIDQLPDDVAAACGVAAKKISAAISNARRTSTRRPVVPKCCLQCCTVALTFNVASDPVGARKSRRAQYLKRQLLIVWMSMSESSG